MSIFNEAKDTYRTSIEESIKFTGKDHEFFIAIKAQLLSEIVKKYLPTIKNPKLLDIGCGHGFIHAYLEKEGYEVVGVEVAEDVLELAKSANPNTTYLSHDGKHLPFESEKFDIAIAMCVMHHVLPAEWNQFLVEMRRIVRPGGIIVIFEHNPFNSLTRYVVSNNILDKDAVLLTSSKLKKLLEKAGFNKVKTDFILFTPFAMKFFRWLDRILNWCPLGAQYYTIAIR